MNRFGTAYCWEMKKLLWYRKGWLFLILVLLLQIGIVCLAAPTEPDAFDRSLYAGYIARFGGIYSEETAQAIRAEAEAVDRFLEQNDPSVLTTAAATESQTEQYLLATMKRNALSALENKCERLASVQAVQPSLTYDLELTNYIQRYRYHWASLIGIAFLVPMLMLGDQKCGMKQILYPTVTGKVILARAKLMTAVTISTLLTAVCAVLQWAIISLHWDLGALDVPVQSITGFEDCMLHSSVLRWILICGMLRILSAPALALLLCILSTLIQKEPAIIAGAAILFWSSALLADQFPTVSFCFLSQTLSGIAAEQNATVTELNAMAAALIVKTGMLGILLTAKRQVCC